MTTPTLITALPTLPPRAPDSHKGTYGKVLIVAGSRGMSGAAVLTAVGALRGGAGLVQLAVPAEVLPIVAGCNPCYLTAALPQDGEGRLTADAADAVCELAATADVLAVGPGLGQSDGVTELVRRLLDRVTVPLVIDADGLNALAKLGPLRCSAPAILTPHPGEFARLLGTTAAAVQQERERLAVQCAEERGVVLVLKGYGTLVTDVRRLARNPTGNAGMAKGGSGDVLTGLIAALLGQKLEPFAAAQLGVYLHGLAGDLARAALGEVAMLPTDLADFLAQAFLHHSATRTAP